MPVDSLEEVEVNEVFEQKEVRFRFKMFERVSWGG